ncbi:MAG: DUF6445 family protein [Pseudomonadota bacterium]
MINSPSIRLNPECKLEKVPIADSSFCIVVDDFLLSPENLIDYACEKADNFYVPKLSYPGLMLQLESEVLKEFHRFVRNRMSKIFGFLRGNASISTGLSMITFKPEQLSNYQRICHTDPRDSVQRRKFAGLVYLYDDEALGGTAFYRYKRFDVVLKALELDGKDPALAHEYLAQHTESFRGPPRYMTESNELAELLTVVQPRFNRLVFYSGEVAHSAHITSPELLSEDFRRGRLTLNCFASVIPK